VSIILNKIKVTVKKYGLIAEDDKILIGVSGGPDSLVLLLLLNNLKKDFEIDLHVAHLDHMLRPDSADDMRFVEGIAGRLKIPITCAKINVKAIARRGSPEEIARNARLGFLFKVAKDIKADKIALGHNLDDQAETVLMRILRGTGLCGLSAIAPKRNISGFCIIRPLIEIRRREIERFLARKKISPRLDSSNQEEAYFRNKIRKSLLPLLEKSYNPNIKEVLSNMAESVSNDYDYLIQKAQLAYSGPEINLKKFLKLHPAMQRLILRLNIARLKGDTRRITFKHIQEIEALILNRPVSSIVDLPKGISVAKKKNRLVFFQRNSTPGI